MLFARPPEPTPEVAYTLLRQAMQALAQRASARALSGRLKDVFDDLITSFTEAGEEATAADRRDMMRQSKAAVERGDDKPRPTATFSNASQLVAANVPGFARRPPAGSVRSSIDVIVSRPPQAIDPDNARAGSL